MIALQRFGIDSRSRRLSPRSEALAFRIWRECEPIGWNCTVSECAAALDVPQPRVTSIVRAKGWTGRFRRTGLEGTGPNFGEAVSSSDAARLAGLRLGVEVMA